MIKSFRGKIADGGQDTIRLSTNKGLIGYRIVKFSLIPKAPGTADAEIVGKIYKVKQDTIDAEVNLTDGALIGVGYFKEGANTGNGELYYTDVIIDNETFNQDIFVTVKDAGGSSQDCNYYLELEQVKLDLSEATVATLKDMRGSN